MTLEKVSSYSKQIRGVSYKKSDLHDDLNENSVILLRANNIYDNELNFDKAVYVDKSRVKPIQYLRKGDIVICASSGSKKLVGKAAQVDFDAEVTFGAFLKVIRPQDIDSEYLGKYFLSNAYRRKISSISEGANINNIRNEHIDDLLLPIVNDALQKKRSLILDKVSNVLRDKKQQLQDYDQLIKSRFVEMFGNVNTNSLNWDFIKIEDIAKCVAGATPSTKKQEYWENGSIPWLSSGEVNKGKIYETNKFITDLGYKNASTKMIPEDTVLIALAGQGKTRGTPAIAKIPLCTNQSICSIVSDKINSEFLYSHLRMQYNELRNSSNGAGGRGGLNLKIIRNHKVIYPPMELQNQFADFVQQVDKLKFEVQKSLEETQTLFDSLMQEYFG